MNVIIVAGGLGTRFKDLSIFPKILLPTQKYNSLLEQDYNTFTNRIDNDLYLIINEKYYDMTVNYCCVNNIQVKIIKSSNTNGSYNTILSVYDQIPHENVLFVWSDLELQMPINAFEEDTIITYSGKYRFGIKNGKIQQFPNYDGNIPGLYYINNLDKYFTKYKLDEKTNYDLVEVLRDCNETINSYKYEYFIEEYRDKEVYVKYIKKQNDGKFPIFNFKTRFFNMIQPDYSDPNNPKIKKWAINKDFYYLIQEEYDWYQKLKRQKLGNYTYDMIVPTVYDGMINNDTGFVMKFLDGYIPLHQFIKTSNEEDVKEVYQTIYNYLQAFKLCSVDVSEEDFLEDLQKEIVIKVIDRCKKIKHMLINYDKDELIKLLDLSYQYIVDHTEINNCKVQYCLCHGDLNGSNIMVNPKDKDVKFIDPRGYFGFTIFYGWQYYEFAKLLYCLDGYDDFNNLPQIYGMDKPIRLKYFDQIDYLNNDKILNILLGIIWVALAGYISQDIMKANIAYEYGIDILKNIFNNE